MHPEIPGFDNWREVGRGGFGVVYRVAEERFGRDVAIKVIRQAGLEQSSLARFERECRALGALSGHPNIVALHDSGHTDDGDPYLVMEYLGGGSMAQRIHAEGTLDVNLVVSFGVALTGGLETAHRAHIVHRDVKPENILLSSYGVPKLVDFGIARMRSAYETRSGVFSGTLAHAAPEVVAGAPASPASDIYSLASVLHTALAGRPPFSKPDEDSLAPLIARIATAAPPDLRERGVPDAVAEVIERALSKRTEDRFGSAVELGEALISAGGPRLASAAVPLSAPENVQAAASELDTGDRDVVRAVGAPETERGGGTPVAAPVPTPTPTSMPVSDEAPASDRNPEESGRRRRWLPVAAAAAVLLLIAGLFVPWFLGDGDDDPLTPPAGAAPPLEVIDPPTEANGLRIERTYAIDDKKERVGSSVTLTNVTKDPVKAIWFEVVPKQLAESVDDVRFGTQPDEVVRKDPIVYWIVNLQPDSTRTISWETAMPRGATADAAYLNDVVALHKKAVEANTDAINRAARQAEKRGEGRAVDPDDTVRGGKDEDPGEDSTDSYTETPGASSPPTSTGSQGGQPTPNRPPALGSLSNRSGDELQSAAFDIPVSDADGDAVTVSVSGLPAGVGISGRRVAGTVRYDAASVTTDRRDGLRTRSFTVTVVARDSHGATDRATFTWTVRDTHRLMPSYIGEFGCGGCGGLPDVAAISTPVFDCLYVEGADGNKIAKQSVKAGSVIRWGQSIKYWYGNDTCD